MHGIYTQDAPQRAMNFLISQAALIEPVVYATKYQDIQYPSLIPVDTTAPEWISTITYFSVDAVGQADWFSGKAQDVPNVELLRDRGESTVSMAAIGYRYDLEELGKAQLIPGMNLNAEKALNARRMSEEFIERVAFTGDASKGMKGLVNQTGVTITQAPADGTGSERTFASKTADQVLRDINSQITGIAVDTLTTELADTVLLPYLTLLDLSTRRIDATNQTTILEWVRRNNIYTLQTGQQLEFRGLVGHLDTAGTGGTRRMVAYRKSPEVVKMHVPMPFRFLPVWQLGPILFEVPGIFRLGGVDVRRPKAMRYLDGI